VTDSERTPYETRILEAFAPSRTDPFGPEPRSIAHAARWLREGVPVVIPTETVYGLAALAHDPESVARIFAIKGRPLDNPLIVHVAGEAQLAALGACLSPLGARLVAAFWPGPLTLVLRASSALPWVTAGLDSIAVRFPAHPFAAALIREVGPLAAPSANLSGRPSPTRARHVALDLDGRVPLIVDGGDLEHGLESTVIDARGERPILLRPGALGVEVIEATCGRPVLLPGESEAARSPGMKYRHYSPRAELWIYPGAVDAPGSALAEDARELRRSGHSVAVIAREGARFDVDGPLVEHFIALPPDPREVGRRLFGWLRELDSRGVDHVLVEGVSRSGVGRAIMDRLERAASRIRGVESDAVRGEGGPA
jgi:L-threonylcarbamoyladenylate synthase